MDNIFSKKIEEVLEIEVNMLHKINQDGVFTLNDLLKKTEEELKLLGLSKNNLKLLKEKLYLYNCKIGMLSKDYPVQ